MYIQIDFESEEAIYLQLKNQIILAIATSALREGDSLPPVRRLAGDIGINMHTVNKAYSMLREEGFVTIDRRHGAVVAVDANKARILQELKTDLTPIVARARCFGVKPEEIANLIEEILGEWEDISK